MILCNFFASFCLDFCLDLFDIPTAEFLTTLIQFLTLSGTLNSYPDKGMKVAF